MDDAERLKMKVCLVGEPSVGKTSLIRRYVEDAFDDRYLTTVGTKVSKKEIRLQPPGRDVPIDVDMMVWDIMGQSDFRDLFVDAYMQGAQGILAVVDLTRLSTLEALFSWIDLIDRAAGKLPTVIAGNKADLPEKAEFGPAVLTRVAQTVGGDFLLTSAKTGANVEEAFHRLASRVVEAQLGAH